MTRATELVFKDVGGGDRIAVLSLDRPDAANSFNDAVIRELVEHLRELRASAKDCRAVILRGKGKHFSAGADLGWMKASAQLGYDENIRDAEGLIQLFEALTSLPMPTVAVVTGAAYGGAVGLTAACDVAIAAESARFSLSEVKLGLAPAVILPYLARKMLPGQLRRLALSGRPFGAAEALAFGLVQRVAPDAELESVLRDELAALLTGSPEAQAAVKQLLAEVVAGSLAQGPHTARTIAGLRVSPAGQAGLASFFDKKPAPWARTLAADWKGLTP